MGNFIRVDKENIINAGGRKVTLRGMSLGGWLMMEGYMLGGRNIPEHKFKNRFRRVFGKGALREFTKLFRENFISQIDFKIIKESGFNCLRIPFNFRLVEDKEGFSYLEKAVSFCKQYHLYCILDLHAAPGSQNPDWHADSAGQSLLWKDEAYQKKFIRIWQVISDRFKTEEAVAGYDILNEPVYTNAAAILGLYKKTVTAIRQIDKNHIIFLEGNNWAQKIRFMGKPWSDNLAYSIHFYMPLEFIFGFMRNLKYPGKILGKHWSKPRLRQILSRYYNIKKAWRVPIYVGEFGQNSLCPQCHKELAWLKDTLDLFKEFDFHWTYWTYKAVAGGIYPDGMYQYLRNPCWINRQGPVFGWETYYYLWKRYKNNIAQSWKTENFQKNEAVSCQFLRGIKD